MFERLVERVERGAAERARQRALALAEELSQALPRRFALERELLWLIARLK